MASSIKNLSEHDNDSVPSAAGLKIGIVVSEYHSDITSPLLEGCTNTLLEFNAHQDDITITFVPGTFELPSGAMFLAETHPLDAVICLGCVIKGETKHDEYINQAVANSLMRLSEKFSKPFIYGVLTPNTLKQAQDRAGGKHGNKGIEAAITAIKMATLRKSLMKTITRTGFK